MKVFFFEPYALAIPHYETALELMQLHVNSNDDVNLFYCNADLNFCEANHHHSLPTCLQCISRRKNGIKAISGADKIRKRNFIKLSAEEEKIVKTWNRTFKDIHELKGYRYENIDLGMAVASSLISYHRNPEPDMIVAANFTNRIFKAALKVYFSFKRLLQEERPDIVYLFNGRFSNIRPVVRLCELNSINYKIHERGANKNKYSLSENHLPHDFNEFQKSIEEHWSADSKNVGIKIAETFYHDRKAGKEQGWYSFVVSQTEKQLPENWNSARRNIVIFNSSEDEFAAIGDTKKMRLFSNQLEGVRHIANLIKDHKEACVYVRLHPNLKGIDDPTVAEIFKIQSDNFHVIEPSSTISSYQLIDSSDLVVTFGSTVGIEATFWGKPSVLLGDALYQGLGSTYNPVSNEELSSLLLSENNPKPKLGAYKYGYYVSSYGIGFNFYVADGLFKGQFKGNKIQPAPWIKKYLKRKALLPIVNFISKLHADKY